MDLRSLLASRDDAGRHRDEYERRHQGLFDEPALGFLFALEAHYWFDPVLREWLLFMLSGVNVWVVVLGSTVYTWSDNLLHCVVILR